ncbi:hypothetical protein [Actinobacillus pleuropneumoniae]|uniref:Uncharacterized protein n=4 Tax=Actinobacillus pleuropneumoniae TaxID=715 RepID=A0A2X4A300_ACTPL|nr:hypothetical protein [Actinobacillus pleuropneumoniae]ACE62010.1 putative membrane protein [Actinobacillus pleuropneumoniae serovar 7 str. AP76]EFL79231.1 hypothetical protein APP2_1031 [Actinobacillus pleuropneumoniae serovar 2 str. 4226]EFL80758.1 hypothetical protein APP6_0194 [Actinobacillus pleuropneumoniae serovar 6 str. Femo]EFM87333.1 hypothetical protein appser2_13100 [Actinobacillus pleuropneumoniae serovar 2 str. S1536]EFM89491.1 hypothetical protein appser4_13390 [Actinobacillus
MSDIFSFLGILIAVYAGYWGYKGAKFTSNKNDYEQWDYLVSHLDDVKSKDKIYQCLLLKSISFFKGFSFGEGYLLTKFALRENITLFELNEILKLRKKKYLKYSYRYNSEVDLYLSLKARKKYSMMLFITAKGFERASWGAFFLFHTYALYTFMYYKKDILPYYNGDINFLGSFYFSILIITEFVVLFKIDTRKAIENFCIKYN